MSVFAVYMLTVKTKRFTVKTNMLSLLACYHSECVGWTAVLNFSFSEQLLRLEQIEEHGGWRDTERKTDHHSAVRQWQTEPTRREKPSDSERLLREDRESGGAVTVTDFSCGVCGCGEASSSTTRGSQMCLFERECVCIAVVLHFIPVDVNCLSAHL